jgi:SAM-dependent methyltransferase
MIDPCAAPSPCLPQSAGPPLCQPLNVASEENAVPKIIRTHPSDPRWVVTRYTPTKLNAPPNMHPDLVSELHAIKSRHWWYRGRRTVLRALLSPHLRTIPSGPILDLGSGPGTNRDLLEPLDRSPFALDSSIEALRLCRDARYAAGTLADAVSIPFRDRSFALVLAADILEHVAGDPAATAEIWRVLKPGGLAVVVVPAFNVLWGWQDQVSGHHRRYSPAALRERLTDSGFEIVRLTCMNTLLALPILVARKLLQVTKLSARSENQLLPGLFNPILYAIFAAETPFVSRWNMPYGTSVVCLARRPL